MPKVPVAMLHTRSAVVDGQSTTLHAGQVYTLPADRPYYVGVPLTEPTLSDAADRASGQRRRDDRVLARVEAQMHRRTSANLTTHCETLSMGIPLHSGPLNGTVPSRTGIGDLR